MTDARPISFSQLIKRSRFNLESAKNAVRFGENEQSDVEALEIYIQNLEGDIRKLEIAQEVEQKQVPTQEDIVKVMGITCYANLGYCCGLDKVCIWRDSCRQALGISDRNYAEVKEATIWQMLSKADKKKTVSSI